MNPVDDIALFQKVKAGDKPAFDKLFRRYYVALSRFALKVSGSETMAEEAVQDVFIYLWENHAKLNISVSVSGFLFQSVKFKVYEKFRSENIRERYNDNFAQDQPEIIEETTPSDDYEIACQIWAAVDRLPEKCAEVFRLSREDGLTYPEIAKHLGISVKTVENQMGIAFKKLREILLPLFKSNLLNLLVCLFVLSHNNASKQFIYKYQNTQTYSKAIAPK